MRTRLLAAIAALFAICMLTSTAGAVTVSGQGAGIKYSYTLPLIVSPGEKISVAGSITNTTKQILLLSVNIESALGDLNDLIYVPILAGKTYSGSTSLTLPTETPAGVYSLTITISDSQGTVKVPVNIVVL
jgi:hypothetical protein